MRTVVLGPRPAELEALIERRHERGQDVFDEVWKGEYHMAPAAHPWHGYVDDELAALLRPLARRAELIATGPFNLGEPDDYRVPDRGVHRRLPSTIFVPTAAVVVEIVSPDDESWSKLDFSAARAVDEVLIVNPSTRAVVWLVLDQNRYREVDSSSVLDVTSAELADQIDWPTADDSSSSL